MNIKKYLKELKIGFKTMFKEFFNLKTMKKQIANMLSFLRLLLPVVAIITTILGQPITSFVLAGIGGLTDLVDGAIARKLNATSEFGKRLDQISDKVFSILVSINLVIINPLFICTGLMEGAISAINTYYKLKYPTINDKSLFIGKAKQFPLFTTLGLGFLTNINEYIKLIIPICILITFIMQAATLSAYSSKKYKEAKLIDSKKDTQQLKIDHHDTVETKEKTLNFCICNNNCKNKNYQKVKKKNRF